MRVVHEPCPHPGFPAHKSVGTIVECGRCRVRFRLEEFGGERYWVSMSWVDRLAARLGRLMPGADA